MDRGGEFLNPSRIGTAARGNRPEDIGFFHFAVPVIEGQRQKHRAGRLLDGGRISAHKRGGNIFRTRRLVAPLDPRPWQVHRVDVREQGLQEKHLPDLLAGGDDERRLVLIGGEDAAHRVAHSGPGVDVDDDRLSQALGKAVGNAHHAGFLQRHHIMEIVRKVFEKGFFGRAGVSDDRGETELPQQIEGDVFDGSHDQLA